MNLTQIKDGNDVYLVDEGENLTRYQRMKSHFYETIDSPDFTDKLNDGFKRYAVPGAVAVGMLNVTTPTFAATSDITEKLTPLMGMLQDLALPLGIIVASWGLIEIILGNFPQGKEKIKYSVVGFVGIFAIPEVFYTIRDIFAN